jgi:hypothetical protein
MKNALSLLLGLSTVAVGCGGGDGGGAASVGDPSAVGGSAQPDGSAVACAACTPIALRDVCSTTRTTLIRDGLPPDDASNAQIQQALLAGCSPAPSPSALEKGASGAVDPMTGQPLAGPDDLLTVAGGLYVQPAVAYLDKVGSTPVYLVADDTKQLVQYVRRAPGNPIVAELPYASSTSGHDLLLIEIARDPTNGTPVLIAFGQKPESTAAAAWYLVNQIIPNRSTYDQNWVAFEWTAADAGTSMASFGTVAPRP